MLLLYMCVYTILQEETYVFRSKCTIVKLSYTYMHTQISITLDDHSPICSYNTPIMQKLVSLRFYNKLYKSPIFPTMSTPLSEITKKKVYREPVYKREHTRTYI